MFNQRHDHIGLLRGLIFFSCAIFVGIAAAQQPSPAKQQLITALEGFVPEVATLRMAEKVGESNTGFLDYQNAPNSQSITPQEKQTVNKVNQLRKSLYAELATETGLTETEVAALRCAQLHPRLQNPSWYQNAGGAWAQNPGSTPPPPPPPPPPVAATERVLTKPMAAIYDQPGSALKVDDNIPAFSSYPVLKKTAVGGEVWYEVSSTKQAPALGWMKESEVLPWKHQLVMEFTNPAPRGPVLFFRDKAGLESLVNDPNRASVAESHLAQAQSSLTNKRPLPPTSPVVAIEPPFSPDLYKELYIMPVLEAPRSRIGKNKIRLLKVACAPLNLGGPDPRIPDFQNVSVDVVFVLDTTGSMQPYLDGLVNVCTAISRQLTDESAFQLRFGFWGYQDDQSKTGIQYLTKNFTPNLEALDPFLRTLKTVKANQATRDEYEEDALTGVADAIQDSAWNPNSIRIIVHAGDAPGLPVSKRYGIDSQGVRRFADPVDVSIASIHIADPKYEGFHADAEKQFRDLSRNPGSTEEAFFQVDASALDKFESNTSDIVKTILGSVIEKVTGKPTLYGVDPAVVGKVESMMDGAFASYLSSQAGSRAPELTAWACSRDLGSPSIESLQTGVLINQQSLSNMITVCTAIVDSVYDATTSGADFFQELTKRVAQFITDPSGKTIGEKGVLSEIKNLPITSGTILDMGSSFSKKTPDQLKEIADTVTAKISYYRAVLNDSSRWQKPNKSAVASEMVTPIPLDMLP